MRFDVRWALAVVVFSACGGPTLGTPLPVPQRSNDLADACAYVDLLGAEDGTVRALLREETRSGTRITVQDLSEGTWSGGPATEFGFRVGMSARFIAPAEIFVAVSDSHGEHQALRYFDGSAWSDLAFDPGLSPDTHQLWLYDALLLSAGRKLVWVYAHPSSGAADSFRAFLADAPGIWTPLTDWQPDYEPYFPGPNGELQKASVTAAGRKLTRTVQAWDAGSWNTVIVETVELPEGLPLVWPSRDSHGRYILEAPRSSTGFSITVHAEVGSTWQSFPVFEMPQNHHAEIVRDGRGGFVLVHWPLDPWSPITLELRRSQGGAWVPEGSYTTSKKAAINVQGVVAGDHLILGWTEAVVTSPFDVPTNCDLRVEQIAL